MVKDKILLFENLSKNMNTSSKTSTPNKLNGISVNKGIVNEANQQFNVSSQSSYDEVPSARMKKLKDFFEIKRPQPKNLKINTNCNSSTKNTNKCELNIEKEKTVNEYKRCTSLREKAKNSNKENKYSTLPKRSALPEFVEETTDISRLVDEFGQQLKKHRIKKSGDDGICCESAADNCCESASDNCCESAADNYCEFTAEENLCDDTPQNTTKENSNEDEPKEATNSEEATESNSIQLNKEANNADKIKQITDIDDQITEIYQSLTELSNFLENQSETISKSNRTQNHDKIKLKKNVLDDDDFGLISLDGNLDDNYSVEAYNDEGNELLITILEISRRSVKLDENSKFRYSKNMQDLINDSDIVFHRDDANSSLEIIKNIDCTDQSDKICDSDANSCRISTANTDDSGIEKDVELRGTHSLAHSMGSLNNNENNICDDDYGACRQEFFSYNNTRCQTVVDNDGNIRIRKVCSIKNDEQEIESPVNEVDQAVKSKLSYIIEELQNTEEQYITGLHKVVFDYKPYIEQNCPSNLIGKSVYLFGNIDLIYEEAKRFSELLKLAGEDTNKIANVFIDSTPMLQLYPKYSKNKPTSDNYIKEFDQVIKKRQKELGDRLDLASYLLTPIQRLGKYILMLENIRKELKKRNMPTTHIAKALEIIRKEMKMGNDSIAIDSIKNCPVNLSTQGSFLMREKFDVIKPKKFETMLFLFENIIVFTYNNSKNLEEFTYFASIEMNDLSIGSFETEPLIFHLSDYPKCKGGQADRYTFVLEAKTPKIKHLWTESIEKRLWEQLEKCRQQLKELHDIQGKRFSNLELPKRKKKRKETLKTRSLTRSTSTFYEDL